MGGNYLSLKEVGEYLGISRVKLWRLVKGGTLPVYSDPLDTRKKLVRKEDVEKLKQPHPEKKQTKK